MEQLQTAFYIVAIVFMSLMIIIMIGIAVALVIIQRKITDLSKNISDKLNFVQRLTANGPDIVTGVGAAVGGMAIEKIKEAFRGKKRRD